MFLFGVFFLIFSSANSWADKIPVTVQLVIAVDVSNSVNEDEYKLQKEGIAQALVSPVFANLIDSCNNLGVGITYVEWSGDLSDDVVQQVIPWTYLASKEDFQKFSQQLLQAPRSSEGLTDVGLSLEFAERLLEISPFEAYRTVVSVSGDGIQNVSPRHQVDPRYKESYVANIIAARHRLVTKGAVVNAIVIGDEFVNPYSNARGLATSLTDYFERYVRGGEGSFNLKAESFQQYSEMIKKQLTFLMNNCVS